jgi:diphthine synthase
LIKGVARAGSETSEVRAGTVENVVNYNFGAPPHIIIFPSKLHFMEAEALITLAGAPEEVRERVQ